MNWYLAVLKKYAVFSGRARRMEYWMFVLFNIIFGMIAFYLDKTLGLAYSEYGYGPIYGLYTLFVLIPSIAVAVRRLHDIGKSGWMLLLVFIPLIGAIWLLVLFVRNGDTGSNSYGTDPKAA